VILLGPPGRGTLAAAPSAHRLAPPRIPSRNREWWPLCSQQHRSGLGERATQPSQEPESSGRRAVRPARCAEPNTHDLREEPVRGRGRLAVAQPGRRAAPGGVQPPGPPPDRIGRMRVSSARSPGRWLQIHARAPDHRRTDYRQGAVGVTGEQTNTPTNNPGEGQRSGRLRRVLRGPRAAHQKERPPAVGVTAGSLPYRGPGSQLPPGDERFDCLKPVRWLLLVWRCR
jgi:hypothetical protein